MIQDIAPHKLHNEYIADKAAGPDDQVFVFDGNSCLVRIEDSQLILPTVSQLDAGEYTYLFAVDDDDHYRASPPVVKAPDGFEFMKLYNIRRAGT